MRMEFPSKERWRVPFWNFVFQGKNKWMDFFRKRYSIDGTIKVKFVEFFFFFRGNWMELKFEEEQLARGWWRSNLLILKKNLWQIIRYIYIVFIGFISLWYLFDRIVLICERRMPFCEFIVRGDSNFVFFHGETFFWLLGIWERCKCNR